MTASGRGSGERPWPLFLRSLLVQASWNYRGMQNLGFATMTIPSLSEPEDRDAGVAVEQAGFFNTHPYLAGAVAGLVVRLRRETPDREEFLRREAAAKELFMGPLGSLGDAVFWASLRPLAGVVGVAAAMAGFPGTGIALFLAVWNAWHLRTRWGGIKAGLGGHDVLVGWLHRADFHGTARIMRRAAMAAAVLLPVAWSLWAGVPDGLPRWVIAVAGFVILPLLLPVMRRLSPRPMSLALAAGALLLAAAWRSWS
jgi:PTS system mannose-specific IID component